MEEYDSTSLERRCIEIAEFSNEYIIPRLNVFGSLDSIRDRVAKTDSNTVFDPFDSQRVPKQEILNYMGDKTQLRNC